MLLHRLATDLAALCQKESKVTAHHCRVWKKDTRIFKAAVKVRYAIPSAFQGRTHM